MDLYRLGEDTLLAGESWKNLYYNGRLQGTFREVGKEVWYKPLSEGTGRDVPRVLYDFSMPVGGKFYYAKYGVPGIFRNEEEAEALGLESSDLQEMTVTLADTVEGRRVLYVAQSNWLVNEERWIEGIGSERGFFERWREYTTDGSIINTRLLSVVADGKTLYFDGELVRNDLPPMLSEGMSWHQEEEKYDETRIISYGLRATGVSGCYSLGDIGLIQEINGKIYYLPCNGLDEFPRFIACCYDFTLEKGDKAVVVNTVYDWMTQYCPKVIDYDTLYVTDVDTVEYNGVARKRLFLDGDQQDVWIEGIGSFKRFIPFVSLNDQENWNMAYSRRLTCCYRGGECLYLHPDYLDCTTLKGESVHPANGGRTLLDVRVTDGTVSFHWTGNRLTGRLYVYAVDGGKVTEIRMDGGTAEVRGLASGIYYYRLELEDTEEAVAGKLLVR